MANEELRQFAERLNAELDVQQVASRHGYLHPNHLKECIQRAANPPGAPTQDYPRMLF
jgi:hypothetical protein